MSQSKNGMTIAQKLGLGFGLIIVLMLICVSCALYGLEVSNSALRNITTFNNQESRQARLLVSDNQDIRIAYRNVMLAEGPSDISAALQAYQTTKQAYMEREKSWPISSARLTTTPRRNWSCWAASRTCAPPPWRWWTRQWTWPTRAGRKTPRKSCKTTSRRRCRRSICN